MNDFFRKNEEKFLDLEEPLRKRCKVFKDRQKAKNNNINQIRGAIISLAFVAKKPKGQADKILKSIFKTPPEEFEPIPYMREDLTIVDGEKKLIVSKDYFDRNMYEHFRLYYQPNYDTALYFNKIAGEIEKEIKQMTRLLPIWSEWGETIRGVGESSLGQILCYAGMPLSKFRSVHKLHKRFGLGWFKHPTKGYPMIQRKYSDKELAEAAGYDPFKRSIAWNFANPVFQLNKDFFRNSFDEYKQRKRVEHECLNRERCGRCHNMAHRYLAKLLIKKLWQAWRGHFNFEEDYFPEEDFARAI